MSHVKNFLYFREMTIRDCCYCLFLIAAPIILIAIALLTKWFLIIGIIFIYCMILSVNSMVLENEHYEKLPKDYKILVLISVCSTVNTLIFLVATALNLDEKSPYFSFVVFLSGATIFFYFWGIGLVLKGIFVWIYYIALKKLFKYQDDAEEFSVTVEELSKYINIKDQARVLNTIIINILIYFVAVIYLMLWVMTFIDLDLSILVKLHEFAVKYNIANFGNAIGLVSLIITIYTVTFSIQSDVFNKAVEDYRLNKEGIK